MIVIKTYSHEFFFELSLLLIHFILMGKEEIRSTKTIINVGYCESTSEWLNRIMTELADESKNYIDLSVLCS